MLDTWKEALAELAVALERGSQKVSMLQAIEERAADAGRRLDSIFIEAAHLFSALYGIDRFCVSAIVDGAPIPLFSSTPDIELAARVRLQSLALPSIETAPEGVICTIPFPHDAAVCWLFDTSNLDRAHEDLRQFATTFASRMASVAEHWLYRERKEAERKAYEVFFDSKLQPTACWAALLKTLDLFVPDLTFMKLDPPPLRQLLVYSEGETSLRIAAGEGSDRSSYVLVDESISGLVIKRRSERTITVDPTLHKELYKGYSSDIPRSELVLRLDAPEGAVGVINIEHSHEAAFNSLYIGCMRDAADFLSPLVAALHARYESFRKKEIGLLYIFTDMLARMGDTYSHLVSQPIFVARGASEQLRREIRERRGKIVQALLPSLELVERSIDEIDLHSREFTEQLPEFISYGSQPVKIRIEHRLKPFRRVATMEGIRLLISETESSLCAFASSLFQEHVFNIVNNSFQQIRTQQFEGKVAEGIITLTIMRSHGVTPLLQQTGLNFVDVVIEDNGGGAPDDVFRKIGRPAFTTKKEHGSGFGVAAAKEYFQSIGGDMSWDNIDGGFRTTIRMQEFDSDIHSETRFIEKIRAEAMR